MNCAGGVGQSADPGGVQVHQHQEPPRQNQRQRRSNSPCRCTPALLPNPPHHLWCSARGCCPVASRQQTARDSRPQTADCSRERSGIPTTRCCHCNRAVCIALTAGVRQVGDLLRRAASPWTSSPAGQHAAGPLGRRAGKCLICITCGAGHSCTVPHTAGFGQFGAVGFSYGGEAALDPVAASGQAPPPWAARAPPSESESDSDSDSSESDEVRPAIPRPFQPLLGALTRPRVSCACARPDVSRRRRSAILRQQRISRPLCPVRQALFEQKSPAAVMTREEKAPGLRQAGGGTPPIL